jgi:hypothetical protein
MKRVYELGVYADPKYPIQGRHAFSTKEEKFYLSQTWQNTKQKLKNSTQN